MKSTETNPISLQKRILPTTHNGQEGRAFSNLQHNLLQASKVFWPILLKINCLVSSIVLLKFQVLSSAFKSLCDLATWLLQISKCPLNGGWDNHKCRSSNTFSVLLKAAGLENTQNPRACRESCVGISLLTGFQNTAQSEKLPACHKPHIVNATCKGFKKQQCLFEAGSAWICILPSSPKLHSLAVHTHSYSKSSGNTKH